MTEHRQEHTVVWFATSSDRMKAEGGIPFSSRFGDVYATVDSECLTASEVREILDERDLDGTVVKEPLLSDDWRP